MRADLANEVVGHACNKRLAPHDHRDTRSEPRQMYGRRPAENPVLALTLAVLAELVIPLTGVERTCAKEKRGCIFEQNAASHPTPHDRTQCPSKHPFCPELFG